MDPVRIEMLRNEWIKTREDIKKVIDVMPDCDYMYKALYEILGMCLQVDQLEIPKEIKPVKKVIKIKKVLPMSELRLTHPEAIVFGGAYVIAEGIAIPEHILRKCNYYSDGHKKFIRISELPDGYDYGTLNDTGYGYGMALKKGGTINSYVNYPRAWEMLNIATDKDFHEKLGGGFYE